VHEAVRGPVCGNRECQTTLIQQQKAAEKREFEATRDRVAEAFASEIKGEAVMAPVPYLDRRVEPTPEAEKRVFRANLRAALRETARRAKDEAPTPFPEDNTPSTLTLNASCIACRGYCCRQGAGHAFLKPEYLPTVLNRRPAESPATIYRDYIRRIPANSMKDACVYQGEEGCVLPRDMRSWICNDYECSDRLRLKAMLEATPDASALVVAMDGATVKAAAIATRDNLDWIEIEPYAAERAQSQ
jgi:hypothetical protein